MHLSNLDVNKRKLVGTVMSQGGNAAWSKKVLMVLCVCALVCVCVRHSSLVRKPSLYCADVSLVCGLFMYAMHHLFNLEIQNEFYFEVWNDFAPSMSDKSGGFCTLLRRTSSSCTFWEVLCSNQTPLGGICLVFCFFFSFSHACLYLLFSSGTNSYCK